MVSIIVPVWNHYRDVTELFLKRIVKTKGEYEIIIVNNGSRDETTKCLKSWEEEYPNIKVINSRTNRGFGGGNNLGFKHVKGEYTLFLSNDVMVEDADWLNRLVEAAKLHPEALLGDKLIPDNRLTNFRGIPTPYIGGYCMFAQTKLFKQLQDEGEVFDEAFGKAYFEDVELSARFTNAGYELIEVPELKLIHLVSKSSDQIDVSLATRQAQRYFTNKMMYSWLKRNNKKRIVFYFGADHPFNDTWLENEGVGGAEAALIFLTRNLAKRGWHVEVYNTAKVTGTFNGVEYHRIEDFRPMDYMDVFVLFRVPYLFLPLVNARAKIFWSCDQYTNGDWGYHVFPYVDQVVAISPYHLENITKKYGSNFKGFRVIDLGINKADYETPVEKVKNKLIFCSVPRRGLDQLARLYQSIKEQVPGVTLTITSDYRLWGVTFRDNEEFVKMFESDPSVSFLAKVPREQLVEEQKSAEIMAYPCTYEECFCIAAMECIAAGAIPVTSDLAALHTTVGDSGILIKGQPGTNEYDKQFVDNIVELLKDTEKAEKIREKGKKRALNTYSWEFITDQWETMIDELGGGEKIMAEKVKCQVEGCGRMLKNSFQLGKHMGKVHGDGVDKALSENLPVVGVSAGAMHVIRTNIPVEVQVNGNKFVSTAGQENYETVVAADYVQAALEIIRNSYGANALII